MFTPLTKVQMMGTMQKTVCVVVSHGGGGGTRNGNIRQVGLSRQLPEFWKILGGKSKVEKIKRGFMSVGRTV